MGHQAQRLRRHPTAAAARQAAPRPPCATACGRSAARWRSSRRTGCPCPAAGHGAGQRRAGSVGCATVFGRYTCAAASSRHPAAAKAFALIMENAISGSPVRRTGGAAEARVCRRLLEQHRLPSFVHVLLTNGIVATGVCGMGGTALATPSMGRAAQQMSCRAARAGILCYIQHRFVHVLSSPESIYLYHELCNTNTVFVT